MKFTGLAIAATLATGIGYGVYEGALPAQIETGQIIAETGEWAAGEYDNKDGQNAWGFFLESEKFGAGARVLMLENRFGETISAWETGKETVIKETFIITDVTGGFVSGEPYGTTGEGIYYDVELFEDFDVDVAVNDVIEIGWLRTNYLKNEWERISIIEKK